MPTGDRRTLAIGAAVWLLVVVVVSAATWTVIDAAGRDVTARPASDPGTVATAAPSTESPASLSPTRRPSRKPRPTRTPAASVTPSATSVSPEATATSAPPQPSPTRGSSSAPAPTAQQRSWTGRAGTVTARCVGARISLVSAYPGNGWRMEIDDTGPGRVRVEFRAGSGSDGEDEAEVEVRAECSGGVPRFRVDS